MQRRSDHLPPRQRVIHEIDMLASEKRRKLPDDAVHKSKQLMDRFNQRLRLNNLRLVERYVKGELHLIVRFFIRGTNEEFVADLQGAQGVVGLEESRRWRQGRSDELLQTCYDMSAQIQVPESRSDSDQVAVLGEVVQFVEHPELVSFPSLVRFERIKGSNDACIDSLYFSLTIGFVLCESFGVFRDREVDVPTIHSRIALEEQSVSQVIENGNHIANRIPGDLRDVIGNAIDMANVIDQFSRVRIALDSDFVWAGIKEGADCLIQIRDVLFGPFDFRPNASERIRG